MTTASDNRIGERIASLETEVKGMTTAVEKLTGKFDELGDKMANKIATEVAHSKANIMQVVNTKADEAMTNHRLTNLERDMATKAPNDSFKEIRNFIIGACLLVLVAFGSGVTALVINTNSNAKTERTQQLQDQRHQQQAQLATIPPPVVVPTK